jgi:hypothetical protein
VALAIPRLMSAGIEIVIGVGERGFRDMAPLLIQRMPFGGA